MKNKPYSLQLLSHRSLLATHDEAIAYINNNYKGNALMAEPALFFYGTEDNVKMILAAGCDDEGNVCLLENEETQLTSDIEQIINASGLVREDGVVVFKPNIDDDIIRHAGSLAEAIELLSDYVKNINQDSITIDDIHFYADDTDTAITNINLENNNTFVVRTDVKLSEDGSIVAANGGISANIDVDVNESTNTITIKIGNNVKTFSLPGVNIIENITYDAANKRILIYVAGQTEPLIVPIGDIVETWSIENPSDSPVELHRHASLDGTEDKVSATLKLRSENNIIGVNPTNGEMYVSRESVTNIMTDALAVYDETISTMQGNIASNSSEITNVKTGLDNEISRATAKEQLLTDSITAANNTIAQEITRAQNAETQLSNRIEAAENTITSVYTKDECDDLFVTDADISEFATISQIEAIDNVLETIDNELDIINGNEAEEGSIKKSLKDAKDYTDSKVNAETQTRTSEINRLETEIAAKANAQDVYTKNEIDAKGYLTDASLALYSTKAELSNAVTALETVDNGQNTRLDALEAKDTTQDNKIANIETELTKINVLEEDTNSIDINVNKTNSGTKIKADLKLDSTQPNIIRVSGNGVYANVDITYNAATNTLIVNNGVDTRNLQLSDHTLVNNGYYDSEHKAIVLVTTIDGEVRNIEIPVSDLLNVLQVENTMDNPIILRLRTDDNGVDFLSASVNISNAPSNAIVNQNGTLYVSKNAADMYATWGVEPQPVTIQQAINELKTKADIVNGLEGDVSDLISDVNTVKNNILVINNTLDNLSDQVDDNTQDIANNTQHITELTTNYNTLSNTVNNIDNRVTVLEGKVSALENEIDVIKDAIGEYDTSLGTITERLAAIETFLQNGLIDANDRNANNEDDDEIRVNGEVW